LLLEQISALKCVQEVVRLAAALVAVLARVQEFVNLNGAIGNEGRPLLVSVRVFQPLTNLRTGRYGKTTRGFPNRERVQYESSNTILFRNRILE